MATTATTTAADDNKEEDVPYYEPVWLQGLRDPTGMLKEKTDTNQIVENTEIVLDGDIIIEQQSVQEMEEAQSFFLTISRLKGLKSIRFLPEKNRIYLFPVLLLTSLLRYTPDLQMFSLCAVEMHGSEEEFIEFLNTLGNHPSLRLVRIIRCRFPEEYTTTTTTATTSSDSSNNSTTTGSTVVVSLLDPLIENLSRIRYLKEMELTPAEESSLGIMSDQSWRTLLVQGSPTLEKIRLENWEISQDKMLQFLESLQNNNQLKGVYISSCQLGPEGLRSLANVLGTNGTLEELSLCLTYNRNQYQEGGDLDDDFVAIAHALEENTSMRQFRISGSNRWPKFQTNRVQQTFLQMLQQRNTTLEVLSIFNDSNNNNPQQQQREIDFLLALNRMGRKRIMDENATKLDRVQVIDNSRVDLNCLYYFLSMKPEILDGTATF